MGQHPRIPEVDRTLQRAEKRINAVEAMANGQSRPQDPLKKGTVLYSRSSSLGRPAVDTLPRSASLLFAGGASREGLDLPSSVAYCIDVCSNAFDDQVSGVGFNAGLEMS